MNDLTILKKVIEYLKMNRSTMTVEDVAKYLKVHRSTFYTCKSEANYNPPNWQQLALQA